MGSGEYDFDLFVIGAGSGGVRAARVARSFGAAVGLAEQSRLGGTCVNLGCIPKKLLVYAAHFAEDFEDAAAYGWELGERRHVWSRLLANKDREIARLNDVYARLLDDAGVRRYQGRATLLDAHTVQVGPERIRARYILLAVGGAPRPPKFPGAELTISSDQMFHLPEMPRRVVIEGGGYIACEFACILHGLGAEVTQIYRGARLLRGFDQDVRAALGEEMRKKGIQLLFETGIVRVEREGEHLVVLTSDGDRIACDQLLAAIGRVPNTRDLGLERAGVAVDTLTGSILVDGYGRTSVPSIYAVGDVTGRIQLTPVALAEGAAVATTLFGGHPTKADHANVPTAVFTIPQVATVGMTEEAARATFGEVDIYRTRFRPLLHTLTGRPERTMMKLLVHPRDGRVLGCHMVGADAGEIVQGIAVAMKCGVTKAQLDATIGIHPTAAEELVTMRTKVTA